MALDKHEPRLDDSDNDGPPDPDNDAPEEWALHITRVANGFIASGLDGVAVFEESDDCAQDPDPDAVARLLWHVMNYFGCLGSKHDPARVRVTVERMGPSGKPN
jgi:hypothetical protein